MPDDVENPDDFGPVADDPAESVPPAPVPDGVDDAVAVAAVEAPMTTEGLDALGEMDRKSKISRTDTQVFSGVMALSLFVFVAAYFKMDLNPFEKGYQSDFPKFAGEALVALLSVTVCRVMNRR